LDMQVNKILITVFILLLTHFVWSQQSKSLAKITLKSGAEFTGEVVLQNDEIVMLRDNTGARFQFAVSEIQNISKVAAEPMYSNPTQVSTLTNASNFCGQIELSTGNAWARKAFETKSVFEADLTFGNRKAFGKELFAGIGGGYLRISDINLTFIPAFIKIQTYPTRNRTSSLIGFESGYAFSTSKNIIGGAFAKISFGINHRLNVKSAIYAGVSAAVYGMSGQLTETVQSTNYTFTGTTAINTVTLKAGFQF